MFNRLRVTVTLLLFILTSAVSNAAIININTTYDLNSNGEPLVNGSVSIANGDSVQLTVDFIDDFALTIGDGDEYFNSWMLSGNNGSEFTIENIEINFDGFSGTGGASSSLYMTTQSAGQAHIGPRFDNFLSAGQSITFSGFEVSFDVQSIAQSPNQYSSLWLLYGGNNISISQVQKVPEPSSLVLFALSLMGLRFFRKTR